MHDMYTASGKKTRKIKLGFVIVLKSKCHVGNYLVEFEHFPLLYCFRINRENLNLLDFWWQDDTYMGLNRMLLFIFIFGSLKKTLLFCPLQLGMEYFPFCALFPVSSEAGQDLFFLPYCRIWGLFAWAFSDFMGFQFQNEFSNMSGLAILLPTCSSKLQCWFHHDKISCMILAAAIISQASLHTNTKRISFSVCYLFLVYIIAFFFQISWGYIQCNDEIMFHW
jgi:hypothetical protein